jgi:hypothetical protein
MHDYVKGVADCMCEDAEEHAPCLECGGSPGSYEHVGDFGVTQVYVESDDAGASDEASG